MDPQKILRGLKKKLSRIIIISKKIKDNLTLSFCKVNKITKFQR
jgi:hypothetical protein